MHQNVSKTFIDRWISVRYHSYVRRLENFTKERMEHMAVYSMGTILKKCRETKGITQEELCYGICTPSALSKMEHGLREPSYVKFASLMERMGEWPEAYDVFIGDKVYRIHELQGEVRTLVFHKEYDEANKVLDELEKELGNYTNETIYHQFLGLERVLCMAKGNITKQQISELENLLMLTVPHFRDVPLFKCFLSHQELVLINSIAVGYGENGYGEKAISLFRELKNHLENRYMGNREKATIYSVVLLNQVKYLGMEGYYEEALEASEDAINILVEIGKTLKISILHYDIAWIYMKMDKNKYEQKIKDELLLSLYLDLGNQNYHSADMTIHFIETNLKEFMQDTNFLQILALYHRVAPAHFQKQTLSE